MSVYNISPLLLRNWLILLLQKLDLAVPQTFKHSYSDFV